MARRKNVKRIDPRYFLHETVNRNDDGSVREEGEALDEDVFSAIGDTATKFFGSKEGKRELFWRKQGKARAEQTFDSVYGDSAEEDFLDKEDILHDAQTIFMAMKGNPKFQASKAVKAAVKNRKDSTSAAGAAGEARLASSAAARAAKEKAEEKAKRAAARSAEEDAFNKSWEAGEEKERKRGEKIRADRRWASQVRSGGPAAGSSTNRRRRRNRGELEEGWTDLFKSKKPEGEKEIRLAKRKIWRKREEKILGWMLDGYERHLERKGKKFSFIHKDQIKKDVLRQVKDAYLKDAEKTDGTWKGDEVFLRTLSSSLPKKFFAARSKAGGARREKEAREQEWEAGREGREHRARVKAEEDAASQAQRTRSAEEKERKKRIAKEKYDWEQGAYTRSQSGPAAGSSTDRSRRRNRGELEE